MKVRVCPLCDQPMKKMHHCDNCNSFIWKPQYIDIHYNTDTVQGSDCSFGAEPHDYDYCEDGSVTMMPSRKKENRNEQKTYENRTDGERRAPSRAKAIAILAVAFSIISIVVELVGNIAVEYPSKVQDINTDLNVYNDTVEEDGEDWYSSDSYGERTDYTDEEVMAGGQECTGMTHMELTADEFFSAAEPLLAELSVETDDYSDSSGNYSYYYDSDYFYTYFTQERMYNMPYDIGSYYNVSWDTYSGKLHEISFNVYGSQHAEDFYVSSMQVLTGDGETFREEFQKQQSVSEKEEYVFFYTEDYEVYINYYEGDSDSYYVSIVKAM